MRPAVKSPPALKSAKSPFFPDFFFAFFPAYLVYLLTLYPTVGTEDSGELIVSAAKLDIAHPSGYPLHTLLGHLFTWLIPFGNIGWRVNVMSAVLGALAVTILYLLIKRLTKNDLIALAVSLFFAFSDIFWSQSIRAEVYTLNSAILAAIAYLLLIWDQTRENKYLYLTALAFGLGISNHHMILLAAPPAFIFALVRSWKTVIRPKTIAICLLLLTLGLSCYAYLPIRTAIAPYDNPAYIKHDGLYTWETFTQFVNRGIYGGTISLTTEENTSQQTQNTQGLITEIGETFSRYFGNLVSNNASGLVLMVKNIFSQLMYLPLLLFVPGIYFLFKKNKRYAVFIFLLLFFYTSIQLTFIGVSPNMHPYTVFTTRPFYIPSIFILAVISGIGLHFLLSMSGSAKKILTYLCVLLLLAPLALNFYANNESRNYIAHDFSLNLLNSLPRNAYLLSTGKDNLTFPLYYLRKIENVRPDVDLEIYYNRKCADRDDLELRMMKRDLKLMFIDLLPCGYNSIGLVPYNFVYVYGDKAGLPPSRPEKYALRGLRKKLDYPNSKLKGLYYLKMALSSPEDMAALDYYFNKVKEEIPDNVQFQNFMRDFRSGKDDTGMF